MLDGRYRIEERIGAGGMATVYRAVQLSIERGVAVKMIRPGVAMVGTSPDEALAEELVKRFHREGRAVAGLRNPHVVRLHDVGQYDEHTLYLVMEYLRGETLAQVLQREGAQPVRRVLRWIEQVCHCLEEAHGAGLVHRDLKPANLFVDPQPGDPYFIKVVDFGIVKQLSGGDETSLTRTMALLGTPRYMAPEQFWDKARVDGRSDLYALGVVAYEALTGARLFEGDWPVLLQKHLKETPPAMRGRAPSLAIPQKVEEFVRWLLAKDPSDRPESAAVAASEAAALREALSPAYDAVVSKAGRSKANTSKAGSSGRSRSKGSRSTKTSRARASGSTTKRSKSGSSKRMRPKTSSATRSDSSAERSKAAAPNSIAQKQSAERLHPGGQQAASAAGTSTRPPSAAQEPARGRPASDAGVVTRPPHGAPRNDLGATSRSHSEDREAWDGQQGRVAEVVEGSLEAVVEAAQALWSFGTKFVLLVLRVLAAIVVVVLVAKGVVWGYQTWRNHRNAVASRPRAHADPPVRVPDAEKAANLYVMRHESLASEPRASGSISGHFTAPDADEAIVWFHDCDWCSNLRPNDAYLLRRAGDGTWEVVKQLDCGVRSYLGSVLFKDGTYGLVEEGGWASMGCGATFFDVCSPGLDKDVSSFEDMTWCPGMDCDNDRRVQADADRRRECAQIAVFNAVEEASHLPDFRTCLERQGLQCPYASAVPGPWFLLGSLRLDVEDGFVRAIHVSTYSRKGLEPAKKHTYVLTGEDDWSVEEIVKDKAAVGLRDE